MSLFNLGMNFGVFLCLCVFYFTPIYIQKKFPTLKIEIPHRTTFILAFGMAFTLFLYLLLFVVLIFIIPNTNYLEVILPTIIFMCFIGIANYSYKQYSIEKRNLQNNLEILKNKNLFS